MDRKWMVVGLAFLIAGVMTTFVVPLTVIVLPTGQPISVGYTNPSTWAGDVSIDAFPAQVTLTVHTDMMGQQMALEEVRLAARSHLGWWNQWDGEVCVREQDGTAISCQTFDELPDAMHTSLNVPMPGNHVLNDDTTYIVDVNLAAPPGGGGLVSWVRGNDLFLASSVETSLEIINPPSVQIVEPALAFLLKGVEAGASIDVELTASFLSANGVESDVAFTAEISEISGFVGLIMNVVGTGGAGGSWSELDVPSVTQGSYTWTEEFTVNNAHQGVIGLNYSVTLTLTHGRDGDFTVTKDFLVTDVAVTEIIDEDDDGGLQYTGKPPSPARMTLGLLPAAFIAVGVVGLVKAKEDWVPENWHLIALGIGVFVGWFTLSMVV